MKPKNSKSAKIARIRRIAIYSFLAFFIFWLILAPLFAKFLITEKPLERADAIFVLGGSATYIERNQKAAELYKKGIAPKVIITNDGLLGGWSQIEERNPPFVDMAKKELISQGVPLDAIEVLQDEVTGTDWEARYFCKKAAASDIRSVLLVTSAYHTSRALWTFEQELKREGLAVEVGVVSPELGQQTPAIYTWWLSARGWSYVVGEYPKFVYYWLAK